MTRKQKLDLIISQSDLRDTCKNLADECGKMISVLWDTRDKNTITKDNFEHLYLRSSYLAARFEVFLAQICIEERVDSVSLHHITEWAKDAHVEAKRKNRRKLIGHNKR